MSGEHTHRSGPRVYHAEDGDYTQKRENYTSVTAMTKRSKHTCKKTTKTTSGAEITMMNC